MKHRQRHILFNEVTGILLRMFGYPLRWLNVNLNGSPSRVGQLQVRAERVQRTESRQSLTDQGLYTYRRMIRFNSYPYRQDHGGEKPELTTETGSSESREAKKRWSSKDRTLGNLSAMQRKRSPSASSAIYSS